MASRFPALTPHEYLALPVDQWAINKAALDVLLNPTGASENLNQIDW
jgi:hypothetical protein